MKVFFPKKNYWTIALKTIFGHTIDLTIALKTFFFGGGGEIDLTIALKTFLGGKLT